MEYTENMMEMERVILNFRVSVSGRNTVDFIGPNH
jgi:hypothetical protein